MLSCLASLLLQAAQSKRSSISLGVLSVVTGGLQDQNKQALAEHALCMGHVDIELLFKLEL
jgi:hypothetical protein